MFIVDSQIIVEITDCRFIGNQRTHNYPSRYLTFSAILKFVNSTAISGGATALINTVV